MRKDSPCGVGRSYLVLNKTIKTPRLILAFLDDIQSILYHAHLCKIHKCTIKKINQSMCK